MTCYPEMNQKITMRLRLFDELDLRNYRAEMLYAADRIEELEMTTSQQSVQIENLSAQLAECRKERSLLIEQITECQRQTQNEIRLRNQYEGRAEDMEAENANLVERLEVAETVMRTLDANTPGGIWKILMYFKK